MPIELFIWQHVPSLLKNFMRTTNSKHADMVTSQQAVPNGVNRVVSRVGEDIHTSMRNKLYHMQTFDARDALFVLSART